MKVLIIPSWYPTEENQFSGIFFKELASSLVKADIEVGVLFFDIKYSIKSLQGFNYNINNGVHEFVWRQKNYTPGIKHGVTLQKILKLETMRRQIERNFGKPDIIHLESCDMIEVSLILSHKWNIPIVYTEHLSNIVSRKTDAYYEKKFKRAIKNSNGCIAISSLYEKEYNKYHPQKLCKIPNGVNIDVDNIDLKRDNKKFFNISALGSLRKIKGYDLLINAFYLFSKEHDDVRLIIGGTGEEESQLTSLVTSLGIEDKVKFEGYIERSKVIEFYRNCDIFVCSSKLETFSIVTAEALCAGIPVVSTKCGGPEDMINKRRGVLVDFGDIRKMADALDYIYNNYHNYDRNQISSEAIKMFSSTYVSKKHIEFYKEIVNDFKYNK